VRLAPVRSILARKARCACAEPMSERLVMSVAAPRSRARAFVFVIFAAFVGVTLVSASASAEIKKMMTMCAGEKPCAWYQASVDPPQGWLEDRDVGAKNRVTILLPDKPELDFSDPMIYVQAAVEAGPDTLDALIAANQDQWRKAAPGLVITPLGSSPRGAGKQPFELFLNENSDQPKQAFEKVAFGFATSLDGERCLLIVVDTAASKAAIDQSSEAFLAVLNGL
jgi:hypothetical protein